MTRVGRRLIEDFLLPALNDQRYGDRLMWVDKDKLHFSIRWSHKNAAKWSLEDTVVFQDWDKMKGHYHPEVKGYYMQSKQRFRAALYKLSTVRKLRTEDKHTKLYQLVLENDKKRTNDYTGKLKIKKEIAVYRPSVICRNTNYIERNSDTDKHLSPPPPLIKTEASHYSSESITFSDNSNSSMGHNSVFSDDVPSDCYRPEIKRKRDLLCTFSQLPYSFKTTFCGMKSPKHEVIERIGADCLELSKPTFHRSPVLSHSTVSVDSHMCYSPNVTNVAQTQASFPEKSLQALQPLQNRHLPVIPSPVYLKKENPVQPLQPRYSNCRDVNSQKGTCNKNDFLQQPVDLSIKRESHKNCDVSVSAR